ncbi:hypothetical protein [Pseudomonas mediterranea]|uniref:hypothetical protein n=1 Tax=Pseudomonas mediterranea TaxID=183795 RepID=UPI001E4C564F|nr:hypothetical protein [Pseudomonas mediterranea]
MKPNCTALVSQPMSVDVAFQARISSSAVLVALNHSERFTVHPLWERACSR